MDHDIPHVQLVEGEDGLGVLLLGLLRHGLLLAGADGGGGKGTRAAVGVGGENGDLGDDQLVAEEVVPPQDHHNPLGHILRVGETPFLGDDTVKARLVQHFGQIVGGGLVLGNDGQAVARPHVGGEILAEELEVLGVGDHVLGAEAEDPSQPLARHTVGQGIHVNRGVAVKEQIKGGGGLLVLGVLARDGPRLNQTLDGLVHLPLPRLESVTYGGVVADDEQGLVGEVVQKTGAFGVEHLHVLV